MGVDITVETFQIVGDDTLRVDLSFNGVVHQDGKELKLDHVRETFYVRGGRRGMQYETVIERMRRDPRQKGKQ